MNHGWIKLHRSILEWEWYDEPNTFRLFLHCILKANRDSKSYRGTIIESGCFVTSLELLSIETGLSVQSIRTSFKKLQLTNELTIKTSSQGTYIQVVKYKEYQLLTSEATNDQQTSNKRLTTNNNKENNNILCENPIYREIAEKYHKVFIKRHGNIKSLVNANLDQWSDLIRKMVEIDKVPLELIVAIKTYFERAIDKEQHTRSFWIDTLKSITSLRKKNKDGVYYYENIRTEIERYSKKDDTFTLTVSKATKYLKEKYDTRH